MNLTEKQLSVYRYLKQYIEAKEISPTYDEIRRHFGFQSFRSVQKHLVQLERKGYIRIPERNRSRMITLIEHGGSTTVLPLAGIVAAGIPIEAIEQEETIDVPEEMLGSGEYFALKVRGNSMVDEGIVEGETIIVRKQATAENGQTVVALVEGAATVKKYFRRGNNVELKPANTSIPSIFVQEGEFTIQGVVVGLLRKYR
ncbi:transcriptional repressor LexA [bacterium]|nr:transcriptional repressor LexA [bacterium]